MDITTDLETINYYPGLKGIVEKFIEIMEIRDKTDGEIWLKLDDLEVEARKALIHDE